MYVKRNPPAPFITSTLQQEAARRLRMSTKRTMILAQKLYEGVNIGDEGPTGLITYMRTDSTRLSEEAVAQVREYIYNNYGKEYVPKESRLFKKGKSSQDAHEAIRPTSIKYAPKTIKKYLDKDMYALYELIWNRFVACQMNPAEFEQISIDVEGGDYLFRATDQKAKFRGFLQVYDDIAKRIPLKMRMVIRLQNFPNIWFTDKELQSAMCCPANILPNRRHAIRKQAS